MQCRPEPREDREAMDVKLAMIDSGDQRAGMWTLGKRWDGT